MTKYQPLGSQVTKSPHSKSSLNLEQSLKGEAQLFGAKPFLQDKAKLLKGIIVNYDYKKRLTAALEVARESIESVYDLGSDLVNNKKSRKTL